MNKCSQRFCENSKNKKCVVCKDTFCQKHVRPTVPSLPDDSPEWLIKERYQDYHSCLVFMKSLRIQI